MSLTEREKEIALECSQDIRSILYEKEIFTLFDLFLSRIREEQEAASYMYCYPPQYGALGELHCSVGKLIPEMGKPVSVIPLFTTPPAAPDCSELMEALDRLSYAVTMQKTVTEQESIALRMANKRAQEALANHAKRMKGEE